MRGKVGEPENDGKYEGKTWDKVACMVVASVIKLYCIPAYPNICAIKTVKKMESTHQQKQPNINFQLQADGDFLEFHFIIYNDNYKLCTLACQKIKVFPN